MAGKHPPVPTNRKVSCSIASVATRSSASCGSKYDANAFLTQVLPRMQGYVNQSIPAHPQLRRAERRMEERGDQRVQVYRTAAEYLSTINLSTGPQWSYALKTFARPTAGDAGHHGIRFAT